MYGYNPPRRPELREVRVRICESEIRGFQERFPTLSRGQILAVMIDAGPQRQAVESALSGLASAVRPDA